MKSGYKEYIVENQDLSEEYSKVIVSRHSVRDFKEDKLRIEDIEFAINCFIETPTACNRQMCSILYIDSQDIKELLDEKVIGLPGFNKPVTQYFVITYDLAAFAYSGERQQGMFNAGLCTTNFINGLHAKGIGSCCLQWSNKYSEDKIVRKALGLRSSERIAVVIGCGYYKNIILFLVQYERLRKKYLELCNSIEVYWKIGSKIFFMLLLHDIYKVNG